MGLKHYYAVAEAGDEGSWWISFPGRDGLIAAAGHARDIVVRAREALESATLHGGRLPTPIEDGAKPPEDLSGFEASAMVVVIPFAAAMATAA